MTGTQELAVGGPNELHANTDANGTYRFASVGQIIFFRKAGYQPIALKRSPTENTADLELQTTNWEVPHCSERQLSERERYGETLLFRVPPSAKTKKGKPDADNWRVFLSFPGNRKQGMIIWSGPLLGGALGHAPEGWYRNASTFSERGDKDYGIIDASGVTAGDLHWRYVTWTTDMAWYHDVSGEAASFFNEVIDSVCFKTH